MRTKKKSEKPTPVKKGRNTPSRGAAAAKNNNELTVTELSPPRNLRKVTTSKNDGKKTPERACKTTNVKNEKTPPKKQIEAKEPVSNIISNNKRQAK